MGKKVVFGAIIVVLLGVSAYLWSGQTDAEVDTRLAVQKESFVCPHCGEAFLLSNDESTAMLRSEGGIVCPHCHKKGSDKEAATIVVGGFGSRSDDADDVEEEPDSDRPAVPSGGMQRKN